MTPVTTKYEKQLIAEGVLTPDQAEAMKRIIHGRIEKAYENSKSHQFNIEEWRNEEWEAIKKTSKYGDIHNTGVSVNVLKELGERISTLPEDWDFHPQVKKIFDHRRKSINEGK